MSGRGGEEGEGESESTIKFILLAFEAEGVKTGEGSGILHSLVAQGHSISWATKEDDIGAIR